MDSRKKMSFSSCSVEFIYMAASPPCRAVWMCIKELGIDVDMRHIDMYKKAEHTQPWFVKVSARNQFRRSYFPPLWLDYWPPATYCGLRPFRSGISINNRDSPPMYGMAYYTPDLCMWMLPIDKNTRTKKQKKKKMIGKSCPAVFLLPKKIPKFQNRNLAIHKFLPFFFFFSFCSWTRNTRCRPSTMTDSSSGKGKRNKKTPKEFRASFYCIIMTSKKKKSLVVVHNTHTIWPPLLLRTGKCLGPRGGAFKSVEEKNKKTLGTKTTKTACTILLGCFSECCALSWRRRIWRHF